MGSILKKAVRGFAEAGVSVADGALAELRQRRLMELQQSFSREERNLDRADRKDERKQDIELRSQERQQEMELRREDKQYQRQRDQSEDAYRQQTLEKSDRQFNETMGARNEEQEFGRVSGAYDSAMGSVGAAQKQLEAAMKMRPEIDPNTGMPINDPGFGASREQAIAQAQEALENARISATKSYKELNTRFPQYQKYFDTTPKTQPAAASIPPLLRKTAMQ